MLPVTLSFLVLISVITTSLAGIPLLHEDTFEDPDMYVLPHHPMSTSTFRYKGGRLLVNPITVYLIWLGEWTENSKQAVRTAILSLNTVDLESRVIPTLSKWWKIVTQYRDLSTGKHVSNSISLGDECSVILGSVLSLTDVLRRAFNVSIQTQEPLRCTGVFHPSRDAVYHLLFNKFTVFNITTFTSYCKGRFRLFKVEEDTPPISLAWHRFPAKKEYCSLWTPYGKFKEPPNVGGGGVDTVISSVLGQTASMATNWDFKGWLSSADLVTSVGQQCPSPTGWEGSQMPVVDSGSSWNVVGVNGSRFLVQQLWDQKRKNCALQAGFEPCKRRSNRNSSTGTIQHGLIVNHSVGLQPYNANLTCEWRVNVPHARHLFIELKYLALEGRDRVHVNYECGYRKWKNTTAKCGRIVLKGQVPGKTLVDAKGSLFVVRFITGPTVSENGMGWDIRYRAGYCTRSTQKINPSVGVLSDGTPDTLRYVKRQNCSWLLNAAPGTRVTLMFTRFDTKPGVDVLTVYHGSNREVAGNYSGKFNDSTRLPNVTLIGPVLLVFTTLSSEGHGWSLNYSMESGTQGSFESCRLSLEGATVLGAACGVLVLSSLVLGTLYLHSRRGWESQKFRRYSVQELRKATDGFSPRHILAEGTRGDVYKGTVKGGEYVVIKSWTSETELEILLRLHAYDRRFVRCIGYAVDAEKKLLVFEYIAGASLSHRLFHDELPPLTWEERLQVAVQVSRLIEYLHHYAEPQVVHSNICSSNILLDSACNVRLCGFGAAFSCNKPGLKAQDVYSYGVLLLELLSGQKAWDESRHEATLHVGECLRAIQSEKGYKILDRRMEREKGSTGVLVKMAEIAAWCMREKSRPSIAEAHLVVKQVFNLFKRI